MRNKTKRVKAEGTIETCISFEKTYVFNLKDGFNLKLPINLSEKGLLKFELFGDVDSNLAVDEEIRSRLLKFTNYLSFLFNVPCSEPNLSGITLSSNKIKQATSQRTIFLKAIIKPTETNIKNLRQLLNKNDNSFVFELYRKCNSTKDLYSSYWYIYTILSVLVGEREDIDKYIMNDFPEVLKGYSDYQKRITTLFIAIRDSFSHKDKKFEGEILDKDKELNAHIHSFKDVARETIIKKLLTR